MPSGRTAREAHRACFLADHKDCIDASSVADSKERQFERPVISFAAEMLFSMSWSDPENLESWNGYSCLAFFSFSLALSTSIHHSLQKQSRCFFPLPSASAAAQVDHPHLYVIHELYRGKVDASADHGRSRIGRCLERRESG